MFEPDEVDDEYFTPVASTTLASIFKQDSSKDGAVNPSLKYQPPQLRKTEDCSKPEDCNTSQCVFSSSVIAYEWVQGTHKCKGTVGFAIMNIVKTGMCKIILYSPDKSTLSCTTITPQLEVTISSGAMMSFYDDHKKYWGLCFNYKNIERVKEQLKKANVSIKPYNNPDIKHEVEVWSTDEATDDSANSITTDDDDATLNKLQINKASIINRIANVGHAIFPSLPESPKKTTVSEANSSADKLNAVLPDVSTRKGHANTIMQELTKSITTQTEQQNVEINNCFSNKMECGRTSVSSFPLINNQIFTYVNGYMVPLHMQVPVLENVDGADNCAEIENIIHKLNNLKSSVRTMEFKQLQNIENSQSNQVLHKISDLEQSIKEKDETIKHLENARKDLCDCVNYLKEQVQNTKQDLKNNKTTLDKEEQIHLNRKVKTLMNNTFHAVASNFDDEANYTGNYVKGILAAVIKKVTIESLVNLFPNDASTSTKGDD